MDKQRYQVIVEEQVEYQIQRIIDYIAEKASPGKAEHVRSGIVQTIRELNHMPTIHKRLDVSGRNREYRRILKWKYVIAFYIDEAEKSVYVVDVSHSAENPQRLIDRLSDL